MDGRTNNMKLFKTPVAHRGYWTAEIPENSMGAFERAIEYGYPIETDIQLSSDNEVMVFHDSTLNRMTQKNGCVIGVKASELNGTKIGGSDFKIPLFRDFLNKVNGRVPLLIELKNTVKNDILCQKAIGLLRGYKGEFAVQSFNPQILVYFKKNAPEIIRGQLATFDYGKDTSVFNAFLLRRMLLNILTKPDFISYNRENLPNRFTDACKKKGIALLTWTVRKQEEYDRLKGYADNIIFEGFKPE